MATANQVKNYLAYWFQLGKQVIAQDGRKHYKPESVVEGDHFSAEFETCWCEILQNEGLGCHLEGTDQTINELLSSRWDVANCVRCDMLVPVPEVALSQLLCPCNDISDWPNEELPKPRLPIDSQRCLKAMRERLESSTQPG
ncbi:MAG: hypothetical protein AAGB19_01915 [Cyanobacteria bacterium P01_F01_bin.3]